jgi:phosphoribosylaminoimidazole-succinocarboxamide synthase
VRDLYEVDQNHILFVCTDRLSAFDVILPQPIPDKGRVLTALSEFWLRNFAEKLISTHLSLADKKVTLESLGLPKEEYEALKGRCMIVRKVTPLPIEAIVRGYLVGSGWKDYKKDGKVCGIALGPNLHNASKLPQPIFTPSTKAEMGKHDLNISFDEACQAVGDVELMTELRDIAIKIYTQASEHAEKRGIIIADTKMEFGVIEEEQGGVKKKKLVLIDELLTPDSSRFWPREEYDEGIKTNKWAEGLNPPSFDKQVVRDYLEGIKWNKAPPAPQLPDNILSLTSQIYNKALTSLVD